MDVNEQIPGKWDQLIKSENSMLKKFNYLFEITNDFAALK